MDGLLRFLKADYLALGIVVTGAVGIMILVSLVFMSGSAEAWGSITESLLARMPQ